MQKSCCLKVIYAWIHHLLHHFLLHHLLLFTKVNCEHWLLLQCHALLCLQYKESFSNWTVLSISVADEDDLPAKFSTYEYNAVVREDVFVVRLKSCAVVMLELLVRQLTLGELYPPNWQTPTHNLTTLLPKQEFTRVGALPLEAFMSPNMPAPLLSRYSTFY